MNIAESRKLAAEAKALAEGATKGEWYVVEGLPVFVKVGSSLGWDNHSYDDIAVMVGGHAQHPKARDKQLIANATFLAASRTLVTDLADRLVAALDRVEELEGRVAQAVPFAQAFANANPKHYWNGVRQDPQGVHEWLRRQEEDENA